MSKSSPSHSFNIQLASQHGVSEAIMIHHFQYWIEFNRRLKKNFRDGKTWMYQTRKEFAAHFPYFTEKQIRTITDSLVRKKIIIIGNFNTKGFDRTLWYAFADEQEFLNQEFSNNVYHCPNGQMEVTKRANGSDQTGTPIPDTKTNTKKDPPPSPSKKAKEPERIKTKEDWRRRISSEWSEEEFEYAWEKLAKSKTRVVKVQSWLETTMQSLRDSKGVSSISEESIKSHREKAYEWDGKRHRGDRVVACQDFVEFIDGSYYKSVRYDVSDHEWNKETGWD